MELTELPVDFDSNLFSSERDKKRNPGLHVSSIIYDLDLTLHPNKYTKPQPEQQSVTYQIMGHIWEQVYTEMFNIAWCEGKPDRLIRPGEMEMDGLYLTADGFDTIDWAVDEWKCTWRSMRRDIEQEFWTWWVQQKAYCKAWGTNESRLRVYFVNGDYKTYQPTIKMWKATYTDRELTQNWEMILNHAHSRGWREKVKKMEEES